MHAGPRRALPAPTPALRMLGAAAAALLALAAAPAARAFDRPLLLFGGPQHEEFLGCLSCPRSEAFSVWNAESEYGSTTDEHSIWNRHGKYGAVSSRLSPWNPSAPQPPLVVDRAGNFYGYFTRNAGFANRITAASVQDPRRSPLERENYRLLLWILDNYDGIIENLDQARMDF